jgi:hypothetical protein
MASSNKTKRKTLLLKSSVLTTTAVMFSLFAAPLISQSVIAQMVASPGSNSTSSSSSANMMATTTTSVGGSGSVFKLSRASIPIDIPLKEGFVNGNTVFYINTDISDQKLASQLTSTSGFRVNYARYLHKYQIKQLHNFMYLRMGLKVQVHSDSN